MKIDCMEKFISAIKKEYSREGSAAVSKIYYRGQSNCNYKLMPTLSRKIDGYIEDDENYIPFEQDIIRRAKLEFPDIFEDNNYFDEIALMKHYGLPTRLLDVTENPLVALYFACNGNRDFDGEFFIFNAGYNANIYTSYDKKRIKKSEKVAFIRAKTFSARQRVQQGMFMWFPDKELKELDKKSPIISKILTVPSNCKELLLNELKMLGISPKTIFPDNTDICCKELIKDITKDAYSI